MQVFASSRKQFRIPEAFFKSCHRLEVKASSDAHLCCNLRQYQMGRDESSSKTVMKSSLLILNIAESIERNGKNNDEELGAYPHIQERTVVDN